MKSFQQSFVIFLQQYLAGSGLAQIAGHWAHPGLQIFHARETEREARELRVCLRV